LSVKLDKPAAKQKPRGDDVCVYIYNQHLLIYTAGRNKVSKGDLMPLALCFAAAAAYLRSTAFIV